MLKKILAIYLGLLLAVISGQRRQVYFEHIELDKMSFQSSIRGIAQDNDGFLWFGTISGLYRYDGYNSKVYRNDPFDENSLSDNVITDVVNDSRGLLWVGTKNGGINIFDPVTEKFNEFKSGFNNFPVITKEINSIYEDSQKNIWICTDGNGLFKINRLSKQVINFRNIKGENSTISSNKVLTVYEDKSGKIWVGTSEGINNYDPVYMKFSKFTINQEETENPGKTAITKFIEDNYGNLWIGSDKGLFRLNLSEQKMKRYTGSYLTEGTLSGNEVTNLYIDSSGKLWISATFGLNIYVPETDSFIRYFRTLSDPLVISNNYIYGVFEDSGNTIWVGKKNGGLNKYNPQAKKFDHYMVDVENVNSVGSNTIRTLFEDKLQNVWIGTYDSGLFYYNRKKNKYFSFENTPLRTVIGNSNISSVLQDNDGDFWIGTWKGLCRIKVKLDEKSDFPQIISFDLFSNNEYDTTTVSCNTIKCVFQDSRENIWVATENGLNLLNRANNKFRRFFNEPGNPNTISDNRIQTKSVCEDIDGSIWVATWNGLNHLLIKNKKDIFNSEIKFVHYFSNYLDTSSISDNRIISTYRDITGTLWFGTYGGGINKVIKSQDGSVKFKSFNTEDGLPNDIIYCIEGDGKGNLWFSTDNGLCKFNPSDGSSSTFNVADGLQSYQFFWGAGYKSPGGRLYFGGANGFNSFYPENIKLNSHIPPVVLTKFSVLDKEKFLGKNLNHIKEIVLSYEQNLVSFEFSALDYAAPERNVYAYKLEGFDEQWNYSVNRRYASYSNLEGGEYVFMVKGTNNNGLWNPTPKSVKIIIIPPLWKTLWFRISAILILVILIIVLIRWQIRRIRNINGELAEELKKRKEIENYLRESKEKAEESENLKSEFLAEMSHEIRTPINSILSYSSLLESELETKIPDELKDGFEIIRKGGKRLIRTIDLILNMSSLQSGRYEANFKYIDLNEVISGVLNELGGKAEIKGLRIHFDKPETEKLVFADFETVNQIFLNIIDNAIKYTRAGEVAVCIISEDNLIKVKVKDTGIGISEDFIPHLFTAFTQEERGYTRRFEGNGLGLALTKKYVELNNAEIFVSSLKKKGTEFIVAFKELAEKTIQA